MMKTNQIRIPYPNFRWLLIILLILLLFLILLFTLFFPQSVATPPLVAPSTSAVSPYQVPEYTTETATEPVLLPAEALQTLEEKAENQALTNRLLASSAVSGPVNQLAADKSPEALTPPAKSAFPASSSAVSTGMLKAMAYAL